MEIIEERMFYLTEMKKLDAQTGENIVFEEPSSLRDAHRALYKETKGHSHGKSGKYNLELSNIFPSRRPFNYLTRTSLNKLLINVPDKGYYLLLRTIELPVQLHVSCIQTVVEDHLGNVILFMIYNFIDPELGLSPENVLPVGTVFILKEPFSKKALNGSIIIRSDCPSDIIFIGRQHELYEDICKQIKWRNSIPETVKIVEPTTGEGWKVRGNELFGEKKYTQALEAYLVALKYSNSPKTTSLVHLNLAAVYLVLRFFESCLDHAQKVLEKDQIQVKALFRAGRACYELRLFREAKEYFDKLLTVDKTNLEAAIETERCIRRLQESNGLVSTPDIFTKGSTDPQTHLDYADYRGPLEITCIQDKGRGIVAASDIEPGTLLVASKALAATFGDPTKFVGDVTVEYGKFILGALLIHKVLKNPNIFGKAVYNLTTNKSGMDDYTTFCDETTLNEPLADTARIQRIIMVNSIALKKDGKKMGLGLFVFPSYFNHSCLPNASWYIYNDVLIVHALKPIRRGEEVTIAYEDIESDYLIRHEQLKLRQFQCDCKLCDLDRLLPASALTRIGFLMKESEVLSTDLSADPATTAFKNAMKKLRVIIREMEQLYQSVGRDKMKVSLMFLYNQLATALLKEEDTLQTLVSIEKALESFGMNSSDLLECAHKDTPYIFTEGCGIYAYSFLSNMVVSVICAHNSRCSPSLVIAWMKVLNLIERVCVGANEAMVRAKFFL